MVVLACSLGLGRLRQECLKFKASITYTVRPEGGALILPNMGAGVGIGRMQGQTPYLVVALYGSI